MKTLPNHTLGERKNRPLGVLLATLLVFGLACSSSAQFSVGTKLWLQDGSILATNSSNGLFPYLNQASTADGNSAAFARCQGQIVAGEYVLLKLSCFDRDNPHWDYYQRRTHAQMSDHFTVGLPEWARHAYEVLHLRVRLHGTLRIPTGTAWSGTQPYGMVGVSATYVSGGPNTYRTEAGEAVLIGGAWPGTIEYMDMNYTEPGTQNLFLDDINALPAPRTEAGYLIWEIDKMLYIPLVEAFNPGEPVTENTVTLDLWVKGMLGEPASWFTINGLPPTCVADFSNSVSLALDGFGPLVPDQGEMGDSTPVPLPAGATCQFGDQDVVFVAPEPPELLFEGISATNDAMLLRFSSLGGARYAVDYAACVDDITPSNSVSVFGSESETEVIVPMASPSNGFYRVRYD